MCYNVKKMCRKSSPTGEGPGEGPAGVECEPSRFGGEPAVISIREGTVLLFYHVTFLSPNNALHKTKKVTNLSHHRLFTCLITRYKDKYKSQIKWETN